MSNSPDAELGLRDPGPPGLALVLNADAFRRALAAVLPGAVFHTLVATYVRYKQGTNCLVAYETDSLTGPQVIYAKAYGRNAHGKLRSARQRAQTQGPFGPHSVVLEEARVVVCIFPYDNKLEVLRLLADPQPRRRLLRGLMPDHPMLWNTQPQRLRYKPERRYVARVSDGHGSAAVLKAYTENRYASAHAGALGFVSRGNLRLPALLGYSNQHASLAFEWLSGRNLADQLCDPAFSSAALWNVGAALAELHAQTPAIDLPDRTHALEAESLVEAAAGIGIVWPRLAAQAMRLVEQIAAGLRRSRPSGWSIHGDFYADQVLLDDDCVGIVDLDRAARGSPALDLGSFCAHLERDVLDNRMSPQRAAHLAEQLLAGYQTKMGRVDSGDLRLYKAARLLRLAVEPFRRREFDWPTRMRILLARAEAVLGSAPAEQSTVALTGLIAAPDLMPRPGTGFSGRDVRSGLPAEVTVTVTVADPHGVGDDPRMPFLANALIPHEVEPHLVRSLGEVASGDLGFDPAEARLSAIRVVRYKPARRCLIEYDLTYAPQASASQTITLMGKARARGLDRATYQLQGHLWNNGFNDASEDGISVPRPLGVVPELNMWLYHKVPGVPATDLWAESEAEGLARRVAHLAHKLHRAGFVARRRHTMADELRILRERLPEVLESHPRWGDRIERVLDACHRLGHSFHSPLTCGIHRDFYTDQILVHEDRLYLIDLDLYCQGDPGLDIGNFQGHLTELALRTLGDAHALAEREQALEDEFLSLAGSRFHTSIKAYATLTLVRHIYLSSRYADRIDFTEPLLDLCEERLGIGSQVSRVGPTRSGVSGN